MELTEWVPSDAEQTQCGSPASFGKMKFKVRNWASYDAGLRRRGSLTLWVTDEAIAKWQAPPAPEPGRPGPLFGYGDRDRLDAPADVSSPVARSEEHTSELQSLRHLVCRLLLE